MSKVSVVVEKVEFMFDGNLGDEAIDSISDGDAMPTTLKVQICSLFMTENRIHGIKKFLRG